MMNNYSCPICKEGYITIDIERIGPRGFRENEYKITNKTCECITHDSEFIAMTIVGTSDKRIENEICKDCGEFEATVEYPINPYSGEYKNICANCFKVKMEQMKEKYSKN
ncbi:TPA: hypothetical protein QCX65_005022 [Bacillus mycoides]|nr:hypothetical protein [Bacillus mycoides]